MESRIVTQVPASNEAAASALRKFVENLPTGIDAAKAANLQRLAEYLGGATAKTADKTDGEGETQIEMLRIEALSR